jgi:exonuclease III
MRLVTWNMGRSRDTHQAAWHYLLSHLKPDVACVQEALASAERFVAGNGSVIWSKGKPGGTGVFVRSGITAKQVPVTVAGSYVAAAAVSMPSGSIRVFSVHVGPESWANQQVFEPWIITEVHAEPSVVGGDMNTSRTFSKKHRNYLDRLIASGVHDCHWSKNGREVPSFWGRQSRGAKYQDDHFFASQSLANSVTACCVDDNPLTRMLSDHGPLVLDLEDNAG